jgi:hypothetical protein
VIEFEAWPKTPRLNREKMFITEKIDGTNAAVGVKLITDRDDFKAGNGPMVAKEVHFDGYTVAVYAQSRKRLVTPMDDNYGFAGWVWRNADELALILGPGLHFGEWWGLGVQRGYGMSGKVFSLFNTKRWHWMNDPEFEGTGIFDALGCVPHLYTGAYDLAAARATLDDLKVHGSVAAPGFMNPEGIVIHLYEAGKNYKMTFDGDQPKGMAA